MFHKLRGLRPNLSIFDLVAPFNFDWDFGDDDNIISLKENKLLLTLGDVTKGSFLYRFDIQKIGFFHLYDGPHIRFESTDAYTGKLHFYKLDSDFSYHVSLKVEKIKKDGEYNVGDEQGITVWITIDKSVYDFFSNKIKKLSDTALPKRQEAQLAWNTRKHAMTAFRPAGPVSPNTGGVGHGAGATRRVGRRRATRRHR